MDRCTICGCDFSTPSFGGAGICPACDCGIQPVAQQKAEIDELRRQNQALRERYNWAIQLCDDNNMPPWKERYEAEIDKAILEDM